MFYSNIYIIKISIGLWGIFKNMSLKEKKMFIMSKFTYYLILLKDGDTI